MQPPYFVIFATYAAAVAGLYPIFWIAGRAFYDGKYSAVARFTFRTRLGLGRKGSGHVDEEEVE